jgi:hypothetical protein
LAARARPCAARTRLFGLIKTPHWALRPPPQPIAASLLLIQPSKLNKIYRTRAARMKGFPEIKCDFSFHWTTEAVKYEVTCPPNPPIADSLILPAIFWGQNYVPVRLLFISSYPSLLISSYSSFLKFESVFCITDLHIN